MRSPVASQLVGSEGSKSISMPDDVRRMPVPGQARWTPANEPHLPGSAHLTGRLQQDDRMRSSTLGIRGRCWATRIGSGNVGSSPPSNSIKAGIPPADATMATAPKQEPSLVIRLGTLAICQPDYIG